MHASSGEGSGASLERPRTIEASPEQEWLLRTPRIAYRRRPFRASLTPARDDTFARTYGFSCNDGDACTVADTCQTGVCVAGAPMVCNGGASCVAGACLAPPCNGGLGFPGPPVVQVGTNPSSVTAADLNGDGKPDLVVANSNTVVASWNGC